MQKKTLTDGQKYDVAIVKLIRNNNVVINKDEMIDDSTYFMLDYFDLLCYKKLVNEDKIYRKFWNFNDYYTKADLNYKVAYKTLSIYAEHSDDVFDIFKIDGNQTTLSEIPFLGIIQINYEYYYQKAEKSKDALSFCEQEIEKYLLENGFSQNQDLRYKIYRSSTSGDFCLVVKTSIIQDIFKIAILINNLTISQDDKKYKFNTYSNIGMECPVRKDNVFVTFRDETIQKNEDCRFALRFTTDNEFAEKLQRKLRNKEAIESVVGLFGRYDYLLRLSMKEFADIYGTLCQSKVTGFTDDNLVYSESMTLTELLSLGIKSRRIRIINERALVPLTEDVFKLKRVLNKEEEQSNEGIDTHEVNSESKAKVARKEFGKYLEKFHELKEIFFEESRAFTDINRALGEVISTYVPQGIENDSYVNWQILTSDLRVIFKCVFAWEESYREEKDKAVCKRERLHFLQDMRRIIDAVNQYYKFLQNVNMHTWQSPLYEIQTQLDAEKMMIAYREFLYEYFKAYKASFERESDDKRPMFYPIVYPDLSIDQACAMGVFQERRELDSRLLICRVPSFEYYGRMFNMIPWVLHEASHSIRTIPRKERNEYLFELVMRGVFSQTMYKLLNQFSNDLGFYKLGKVENDIVDIIVQTVRQEFIKWYTSKVESEDVFLLEFNRFETEILKFLFLIFDRSDSNMERSTGNESIRAIQGKLFCFLGNLNLLNEKIMIGDREVPIKDAVPACIQKSDIFYELLRAIYNAYYKDLVGSEAPEQGWKVIVQDVYDLEESLLANVEHLKLDHEQKRDYLFKMRELNRLYEAWCRRGEDSANCIRTDIWLGCLLDIREKISCGFDDYDGFAELYGILNSIFGYEDVIDEKQAERVGKDFNILSQDEVYDLVQREVRIYRETCADLYMATALGLTAFGYCREIFQTVSDTGTEEDIEESNSTNIERFRMVAAVLLGAEQAIEESERYIRVPAQKIFEEGKKYCHRAFECAENIILRNIQKQGESSGKKAAVERVYQCLNRDVDELFVYLAQDELYDEKIEDSMLAIYLNPQLIDSIEGDRSEEAIKELKESLKCAEKELGTQRHIVYRIKYFISALNLISVKGNILIGKKEYSYFEGVYKKQKKVCETFGKNETCKVVSEFYNNADSAVSKSHASMLEDTLDFIQTYYYRDRFEVMSSSRAGGDKKIDKKSNT